MSSLKLNDIHLEYYENIALKIDEFCADSSFALIGCSGSGKSNFLKVIAGLEEIKSGYIYIDGIECGGKKPRHRDVSLISARTPLFTNKSAYYNLIYPLKKRKISKKEIAERVDEILKFLQTFGENKNDQINDLGGDLHAKTHTSPQNVNELFSHFDLKQKVKNLSPSQRTALIFARAIIKNPRILLLDEIGDIVEDMPLFLHLLTESKCFYIFATYDFDLAVRAANSYVILKRGDIVFDGNLEQLQNTTDEYIKKMCFLDSQPNI